MNNPEISKYIKSLVKMSKSEVYSQFSRSNRVSCSNATKNDMISDLVESKFGRKAVRAHFAS